MDYALVLGGESKIVSQREAVKGVATLNLGGDVAVTCYNPVSRKAGLARGIDAVALAAFVKAIAGEDKAILQVRLVGGNATPESMQQLQRLVADLQAIDGGRDGINIISADIHEKPHPESFAITTADGALKEI